MIGGGKYEAETTELRHKLKAKGVMVIVFEGQHGNGFSVQLPPHAAAKIPDVLREMAAKIEKDIQFLTTEQPQG